MGCLSQPGGGDASAVQVILQDIARGNGRQPFPGGNVRKIHRFQFFNTNTHDDTSMVIYHFNIKCVTVNPAETNTPLPVDPKTPQALTVAAQLFQPV